MVNFILSINHIRVYLSINNGGSLFWDFYNCFCIANFYDYIMCVRLAVSVSLELIAYKIKRVLPPTLITRISNKYVK